MPLFPCFLLRHSPKCKAMFLSSLNSRVLAVCFSNVLFACFTVPSPPFRGPFSVDSPHWMRKCPSLLGFNFFSSVQPADWTTPRRCIPPFDRGLASPDDVLGANSSYRKQCLNRSSSARVASLSLIPRILDNFPIRITCYLLLRASRSAVAMSDLGMPKR